MCCHQAYYEKMRHHLGSSVDPTDASLEVVLPGVHQRFSALAQQVDHHHNEMVENWGALKSDMSDMKQFRAQFTRMVERALEGFRGTTTTSPSRQSPIPTRQATEEIGSNNATIPSFSGIYISQRFGSLEDLWMEWWGQGDYEGKPIEGGFAQLEELYKAKWRGHLDAAQKRHFSRIKLIVGGIKTMIETSDQPACLVLADLDEIFRNDLKKSIAGLLKKFQQEGVVKVQKARGRHVQASN